MDGRSTRHVDVDGYDLLSRMLELDPRRRINATAALTHPYIARAAARQVHSVGGHNSPHPAARQATSAHITTIQSEAAASRVRALRANASATYPPAVHVAPGAYHGVHVAPRVGYILLANPFKHGATGRVQVRLPNMRSLPNSARR